MNKLPVIFFLTFSISGFSQQRVGLELFSHLDHLSIGTHYQKVIYSKFLVGAGLVWMKNRRGEAFQDKSPNGIHTAIIDIPESFDRNNEKYVVQGYRTISKALMLTLNTGYFHEFGSVHGIRVNLNGRIGVSQNSGTYTYLGMINDTVIPVHYQKNHLVTAISPEIYHTLRQRSKLTFYYGLRFPIYFSMDKKNFHPMFRKDGFYGPEMEVVVGITYFLGKTKESD
ncbi:hypothetical protein D3C71_439550 [compost metagenome]